MCTGSVTCHYWGNCEWSNLGSSCEASERGETDPIKGTCECDDLTGTSAPCSTCGISNGCFPICGTIGGPITPGEGTCQWITDTCDGYYCGDGTCDPGETSANCPGDCPPTGSVCPNGICESGEDCTTCEDCSCGSGTWGACGSCSTCGFSPAECRLDPGGNCVWGGAACQSGGVPCQIYSDYNSGTCLQYGESKSFCSVNPSVGAYPDCECCTGLEGATCTCACPDIYAGVPAVPDYYRPDASNRVYVDATSGKAEVVVNRADKADWYEIRIYPQGTASPVCASPYAVCRTFKSTWLLEWIDGDNRHVIDFFPNINAGNKYTVQVRSKNTDCSQIKYSAWNTQNFTIYSNIRAEFFEDLDGSCTSSNPVTPGESGHRAYATADDGMGNDFTGRVDNPYRNLLVPWWPNGIYTVSADLGQYQEAGVWLDWYCNCPNGCSKSGVSSVAPYEIVPFYVSKTNLSGSGWFQVLGGNIYAAQASNPAISDPIPVETCNESGTCKASMIDFSGTSAAYTQAADENGLVIIETERYQGSRQPNADDKAWELKIDKAGYSYNGYMEALPNTGGTPGFLDNGFVDTSPRLDYTVNFTKTGTHYIWARGWAADGTEDSYHVGLDGQAVNTADDAVIPNLSSWAWNNKDLDSNVLSLNITEAGTHTINFYMREDGSKIDKLILTTNPNYAPVDGDLVSIEAENYSSSDQPKSSHSWELRTSTAGYSSSGYMESTPNSGSAIVSNYVSTSPRLDYLTNFSQEGTYYVWVRGWSSNGGNDSFHIGLDETASSTSDNGVIANSSAWVWSNEDYPDHNRLRLNVPSTGEHRVNLYMREDGSRIDRIILTKDPNFIPSGNSSYFLDDTDQDFSKISSGVAVTGGGNIDSSNEPGTQTSYISIENPATYALGSQMSAAQEDFDFFVNLMNVDTSKDDSADFGSANNAQKPSGSHPDYYYVPGNLNINQNTWNVGSSEKITVFVDGNLLISDPNNLQQLITVQEGGFLAFIVSGHINIDGNVGNEADLTSNTTNLEGVYIATGHISIGSKGASSGGDEHFVGAGTFVGWEDVVLERDYSDGGLRKAENNDKPVETFIFRPDLVVNAPESMAAPSLVWEEAI